MNKKRHKIISIAAAVSLLLPVVSSARLSFAAEDIKPVLITQVQITGGPGKTDHDFIELINPTDQTVNLKGYRLVKRSATGTKDSSIKSWSEDTFLKPRSFYLWANTNFDSSIKSPDTTGTTTISADNGVGLRFGSLDTGILVDSIAWGDTSNTFKSISSVNPSDNQSLNRVNPLNESSLFEIVASSPKNSFDVFVVPNEPDPEPIPAPTDPTEPEPGPSPSDDQQTDTNTPPADNTPTPDQTTPPTETPTEPDQSPDSDSIPPSENDQTPSESENNQDEPSEQTPQEPPQSEPTQTDQVPAPTQVLTFSNDIKINEILANPAGEDDGKEAVELINLGVTAVNLQDWVIDDKSTTGTFSKNAYHIGSVILLPNQIISIIIPSGKFTMNNGKETINLYAKTGERVDQINYDKTKEGLSYQKIGTAWFNLVPTLGSANFDASTSSNSLNIQISEILPNPKGSDDGKEWIEFHNKGTAPINLSGFVLDHHTNEQTPSSKKFVLGNVIIPQGGYKQIIIPEDNFSLKNTGQESVRLFAPSGQLIKEIIFTQLPESRTWALDSDSVYKIAWPTPNEPNIFTLPVNPLKITRLLPKPNNNQSEFIEIHNSSDSQVSLTGVKLLINTKQINLSNYSASISAGSNLLLDEDDLTVNLTNTHGTIKLLDRFDQVITSLTYGNAPKGQVYTLQGQQYVWVNATTSNQATNMVTSSEGSESFQILDVGGPTDEDISQTEQVTSNIKPSISLTTEAKTKTITKKATKPTTKKTTTVKPKIATKKQPVNPVTLITQTVVPAKQSIDTTELVSTEEGVEDVAPTSTKQKSSPVPYVALGTTSLLAFGFLTKKLQKTKTPDPEPEAVF